MIVCSKCKRPYPEFGLPFRCLDCGGDFELDQLPQIDFSKIESNQPGIWKYRHSFYNDGKPVISLGEGDTPLVSLDSSDDVWGKLESLNPTGSYKDRVMTLIVSQVVSRGGKSAVEDSSGNAGAAFAAYSARAGIKGCVFVPAYTGQAKIDQIEIFGAEVRKIEGPRAAAAEAVLKATERGNLYASHAYLPFGLPGIATIAYEIYQQLGENVPASVVVPVGHGHLLRGIIDGFLALQYKGYVDDLPKFIGVQAERCAPIANAWKNGQCKIQPVEPLHTIAEGTAVTTPRQGDTLLELFAKGLGEFVTVSEESIVESFHALARKGIYVEPTSAMVWSAFHQLKPLPKPCVLILTGNGLKYTIGH